MGYVIYAPSANEEKFFQELVKNQQVGFGYGFVGTPYQRGAGLGSIFASLFRAIAPMAKSAAKTVGKRALNAGLNVASDVLSGQNPKEALKMRGKEMGGDLIQDVKSAVRKRGRRGMKGGRRGAPGKRKKKNSVFD